jgi:hypothetical protein
MPSVQKLARMTARMSGRNWVVPPEEQDDPPNGIK